MRRKSIFVLVLLALSLSATLLTAMAQSDWFEIPWWSVDGGGTSQGGPYTLSGSIGQANAGNAAGGNYVLGSGFWMITLAESRIYLPLMAR